MKPKKINNVCTYIYRNALNNFKIKKTIYLQRVVILKLYVIELKLYYF